MLKEQSVYKRNITGSAWSGMSHLSIARQHDALLRAHHKLARTTCGLILHAHTAQYHVRAFLLFAIGNVSYKQICS